MRSSMDLIDRLREIVGERVSAAPSERLCYSSDASMVKGTPDCVVRLLSTEEVSKVVALAAEGGVADGAGHLRGVEPVSSPGIDSILTSWTGQWGVPTRANNSLR